MIFQRGSCFLVHRRDSGFARRGFSLLELLVVISIIAILGGAFSLGLGRSSAPSVQTAADAIYAQLQSARTAAVMKNATARLLIESVPESALKTQRMIIIADPANNGTWTPSSQWMRLPQGTFVILEGDMPRSTKGGADGGDSPPESMTYNGADFVFYEFSPTGSCERNVAARLVIGAGQHADGLWVRQNNSLVHGLFLTRLGEPVFFEDLDHIMTASQ